MLIASAQLTNLLNNPGLDTELGTGHGCTKTRALIQQAKLWDIAEQLR